VEKLQGFIDKFSAGTRAASAQSRKKQLEKMDLLAAPEAPPPVLTGRAASLASVMTGHAASLASVLTGHAVSHALEPSCSLRASQRSNGCSKD